MNENRRLVKGDCVTPISKDDVLYGFVGIVHDYFYADDYTVNFKSEKDKINKKYEGSQSPLWKCYTFTEDIGRVYSRSELKLIPSFFGEEINPNNLDMLGV